MWPMGLLFILAKLIIIQDSIFFGSVFNSVVKGYGVKFNKSAAA
jgi:hypothetical protein